MQVNMSAVIGVAQSDEITTVVCKPNHKSEATYTYKCQNTLARTLTPGDRCLVRTGNAKGVSIMEVVEVHETPKFDMSDMHIDYKWLFQRVDSKLLGQLEFRDNLIKEKLNAKKQESAQTQILAAFGIGSITELNIPSLEALDSQ